MSELEKLKQAIEALQAQRAILGNDVVDAALGPLRDKILALSGGEREPEHLRKIATVLFMDIVGSTQIGQGRDPEEIMEIMDGALERLSTPVEHYGGQVTRFMGDGFKAVFGLPVAHENDTRQAVRAGLAIIESARIYEGELFHQREIEGFNVRVGVNTGLVVTGGFSEAGDTIMGLTVNLAARLESAAPPGGVLISGYTYQHVKGAFDVESQEPIQAKGFPEPVPVYLVKRAKPRAFRPETRGLQGIETKMVGRDPELQQLKNYFINITHEPKTHLVTIIGDPGIGKSRLLDEFVRWLESEYVDVLYLKGRATEEMRSTPFGLLRDLFALTFNIQESDPVQTVHQKLENRLARYFDEEPQMKVHFVGALLGYDFSDSPYLKGVQDDYEQIKERAIYYLQVQLTKMTQEYPTVFLLEDIHWADAASLEAILQIVRECDSLNMMVVCLARPELYEDFPQWGAFPDSSDVTLSILKLEPLNKSLCEQLVLEILQKADTIPQSLRKMIISSSDGNPFYVEELIKMLIDDGIITQVPGGKVWHVDIEKLEDLRVPPTLTALLQARLDSLPLEEKKCLQQASVAGRVFWDDMIKTIQGGERPPTRILENLGKRELISPREESAFDRAGEYIFKHAILRDVAYETVLKRERRNYHRTVATWLIEITQKVGRTDEFAGIIAEHFDSAGDMKTVAKWYIRAGERARSLASPVEARKFFDQALESIPEIDLEQRWQALSGRSMVLSALGEVEAEERDNTVLVKLAEQMGDDNYLAEAYYLQAFSLSKFGKNQEAISNFTVALSAAKRSGNRALESRTMAGMMLSHTRLGNLEATRKLATDAQKIAKSLGDDSTLVRVLSGISIYTTVSGDIANGAQIAQQQVTICHQMENRYGETNGLINLGYNFLLLGLFPLSIQTLSKALSLAESMGSRRWMADAKLNLGLAFFRAGNSRKAEEVLIQAKSLVEGLKDEFGKAICQTYLGLTKEKYGDPRIAIDHFKTANTSLSKIGARGYALDAFAGIVRCTLGLGNIRGAAKSVVKLWSDLEEQGGKGLEFPIMAYLTCADAFMRTEKNQQAQIAIETGYRKLIDQADKINDPEWRKSFLENITEHFVLIRRRQLVMGDVMECIDATKNIFKRDL